jgi:hypothetical protein
MKNRQPYCSITFTPSEEARKQLVEFMRETGHPVSTIVSRCVDYALTKVELKPIKKDVFFME